MSIPQIPAVISGTGQIVGATDVPKEGLSLGRHGGQEFGVRFPLTPLATDGIVEVENGNSVVFGLGPAGRAVREGFREDEQGACRARIGVPERRVSILYGFGCVVGRLMASGCQKGAALAIFDGGEFPDHPGESAEGFAGNALIEVGVHSKSEQTAAVVRTEFAFIFRRGGAKANAGGFHSETVAVGIGQVGGGLRTRS